jgi:hypothetical protein
MSTGDIGITFLLSGKDQASPALKAVANQTKAYSKEVKGASTATQLYSASLTKAQLALTKCGTAVGKLTTREKILKNDVKTLDTEMKKNIITQKLLGIQTDNLSKSSGRTATNITKMTRAINSMKSGTAFGLLGGLTTGMTVFGAAIAGIMVPLGALLVFFKSFGSMAGLADKVAGVDRLQKLMPVFNEFRAAWQAINHLWELAAERIYEILGGQEKGVETAKKMREALAKLVEIMAYFGDLGMQVIVNLSKAVENMLAGGFEGVVNVLEGFLQKSLEIAVIWNLITGNMIGALVAGGALVAIGLDKQGYENAMRKKSEASTILSGSDAEIDAELTRRAHARFEREGGNWVDGVYLPGMGDASQNQATIDRYKREELAKLERARDADATHGLSAGMGGAADGLLNALGLGKLDKAGAARFGKDAGDMVRTHQYYDESIKALDANTRALQYTTGALADFHGFVDIARQRMSVLGGMNSSALYGSLSSMNQASYAYDTNTGGVSMRGSSIGGSNGGSSNISLAPTINVNMGVNKLDEGNANTFAKYVMDEMATIFASEVGTYRKMST